MGGWSGKKVLLVVGIMAGCLLLLPGFFPSTTYTADAAPFCVGSSRLECKDYRESRRLPPAYYMPPSPVPNKQIRQEEPRPPPIKQAAAAPPSPCT
ncbi:hypothetical protein KSP40_PGU007264 [Platanthera guangdongensis]|uniref:Uncharacterized protein n=1 Tax=Platanthera guangdongensis TaxID=2320717 RepID=A0ABR2LUL0_9ASPA